MPEGAKSSGGKHAVIETSQGPIALEFFVDESPIAVENFQMLQGRQTADTLAGPQDKGTRINLLNWDGKGSPPGLFPSKGPDS